ncbi:hypothetical protein HanXRQr2_Chr14g0644081 [Helianthus annuus]|uniref:Uncharacterized protein n=1 Tax=Helianthus annuus TaxID=4232 RepID=A0A9K3EAX3_HELAN|nr:hypothetical protein HanXRQr2_Chr14g0644081 [Helianthus annuus]KAJ0840378.1 hypothetical protein HanPSC8_Chr14g0617951 [Helianthus annuus]
MYYPKFSVYIIKSYQYAFAHLPYFIQVKPFVTVISDEMQYTITKKLKHHT